MYYYQNNFMFLFCIPKVDFKKKNHCTTIYMYIYTYTHTHRICMLKIQLFLNYAILLKWIHVGVCDQVIRIILSHFSSCFKFAKSYGLFYIRQVHKLVFQ